MDRSTYRVVGLWRRGVVSVCLNVERYKVFVAARYIYKDTFDILHRDPHLPLSFFDLHRKRNGVSSRVVDLVNLIGQNDEGSLIQVHDAEDLGNTRQVSTQRLILGCVANPAGIVFELIAARFGGHVKGSIVQDLHCRHNTVYWHTRHGDHLVDMGGLMYYSADPNRVLKWRSFGQRRFKVPQQLNGSY
jgi:hypothetical protein